jgi:exonuclease SbcD
MAESSIRMLHFADVHIGMENYGKIDPDTGTSTRVRDFLDRLDEAIDFALENRADLAVFSGDAFKSRNPDPTQQREFAHRIKRLADTMPILLLVGNHDMPGMMAKANSLDIFRALDVPGVIVGHRIDKAIIETQSGPVFLAWIPYPMRNRLLAREEHVGKSIEELENTLRSVLTDNLNVLAQEAGKHDMPRVLAGHFSVSEAKWGSERSVMLGRDVTVPISSLANEAWDYVALGHIHKHQDVHPNSYPPVVYSGSLERIDFGEEREAKGFCWVELARGRTTWNFIEVSARPFHTISVDVCEELDLNKKVIDALEKIQLTDAVIRVKVQMRPEQVSALREREIQEVAQEAMSFSIIREVETDERARLGDLEPETLAPIELLERYLSTREVDPERMDVLLAKAQELFDTS